MKKKNILLIAIIVIIIIIVIVLFLMINNNKKESNKYIEEASLLWASDHNFLYNKLTIGALYKNGYINNISKYDMCNVINVSNNKVTITKELDCNYNEEISKIATVDVKLINVSNNEDVTDNWSNDDVKIELSYKNNNIDKDKIKEIYITSNEGIIAKEELIIRTNSYFNKEIEINIILEDGTNIATKKLVTIDKIKPTFLSKKIESNNFEAIFDDNESGIIDILYAASTKEEAPQDINLYKNKEQLVFESQETYHIYSIAKDLAGNTSDIVYVGEYKKNVVQSGAGGGSSKDTDNK